MRRHTISCLPPSSQKQLRKQAVTNFMFGAGSPFVEWSASVLSLR